MPAQNITKSLGDLTKYVDLRAIRVNAIQTPQLLNQSVINQLVDEIRELGFLLKEPIGRRMEANPNLIELADGVHRFYAFKCLHERHPTEGWGVMPVKIVDFGDKEFFRTMWMGNEQRRMSPLERGVWLLKMQQQGDLTQSDLMAISGLSQQMISRYICVARAPEWLQQAVHNWLVPTSKITHLKDLPSEQARELIDRLTQARTDQRAVIVDQVVRAQTNRQGRADTRDRRANVCPVCSQMPERLDYDAAHNRFVCSNCGTALVAQLQIRGALGRPSKREKNARAGQLPDTPQI